MSWLALTLIALAPPVDAPSIVEVEEVSERAVLVLKLKTSAPELEGQAALLSDIVAAELSTRREIRVVTEADIEKLLALEAERQVSGCDDESCLEELAGAIGAELVLYGRVESLGARQAVSLNLFSQKTATSEGRATAEGRPEEMGAKVRALVTELLPPTLAPVEEEARGAGPLWLTLGGAGVAAAGALTALVGLVPLMSSGFTAAEKDLALVGGRVGLGALAVGTVGAVAGGVWMAAE